MKLIFATNNEHKKREILDILGNDIRLIMLNEAGITEDIPENEPTLEANALHKARYVYTRTGGDVFADDTGLEVEALGGEPGVRSARFAGEGKDSEANIMKLLMLLEGAENRRARFRTVIALIYDGKEYLFEGLIRGSIASGKKGDQGFGYDPVFIPEDGKHTFAEMTLAEKNLISHRSRAFEKLKFFLLKERDLRQ
jgi:XTP/dITP diphosphohydrolase